MGFSLTGFIIAVAIFAPNLLMIIFPPHNMPAELKDTGILFTALERIGQIGCLALLVISKDNFQSRFIGIWIILAMLCIAAYYGLWIRYVALGREFSLLFKFYAIPIPMAALPVLAFGFIAVWGKSIPLGAATVLFSIGHIANSLNTYYALR
jgi:hypothetical protein